MLCHYTFSRPKNITPYSCGFAQNEMPKLATNCQSRAVKLVVSDCIRWLKKIVSHIFPNAKWQRCIFHLIKDAGYKIKNYRAKRSFQKMLGWVFKAPSVRAFWERWKKFKDKWQWRQPKAFRIVELGLDDATVFFQFPRHSY